jgi:hypothetical protein
MNLHALPKEDDQSLSRHGILDGMVVVQSHVPPFTTAGLLDYIVELVVCEDEVFEFLCLRYTDIYYSVCIGISAR